MKLSYLAPILATLLTFTASAHAGDQSHTDEDGKSRYIELSELGNPADVLTVKTSKSQPLNSGEIRVDVLAAPIHPSDLLQISGNYGSSPELPYTPGSEGVGRVKEISDEVKHLAVGQLVLLAGGGSWREQIVAPADQFIPLPNLGSPSSELIEQLAMTAVNPLAAHLMLTSFADLKEGDWLVQSAANSAVGSYLIQLAKQRGIKTVNVVRREGLADELKSKGADVVLIDGPDLTKDIAKATDNAHISLAIDAVGGATLPRLANSLGYGSTVVAYGVLSGKPATINPAITIFNDIRIRGFWLSKWFETASMQEKQAAFGEIIPLVVGGQLSANVDSRFALDDIAQAVNRSSEGGRNGKVLIVPNEHE